jgi:hypothetical protein
MTRTKTPGLRAADRFVRKVTYTAAGAAGATLGYAVLYLGGVA